MAPAGLGVAVRTLIEMDRGLDVSPERFAALWNEDERACDIAYAEPAKPQADLAAEMLAAAVVVLSSIGTGLATNALYDAIKRCFRRLEPSVDIELEQYLLSDGTVITRIRSTRG